MWALPSGTYTYRPLKEGLSGYDVWVLQLNLNAVGSNVLTADGYFGPKTKSGVSAYQLAHGLSPVDGIAGIATETSICLVSANPAQQKYSTPSGLIRGIIEGETSFLLPAVSVKYHNGSRDIGALQENLSASDLSTEQVVTDSFICKNASDRALSKLRGRKDAYYRFKSTLGNENCWRYAVLYHNWPSAADAYAFKNINTWTYVARYVPTDAGPDDGFTISYNSDGSQNRSYHMTSNAQWIYAASGGRLKTGFEWSNSYMDKNTKYVTNWTN